MGRPSKNSGTPDAKERIYQAFWTLLEQNRLHDITVGMISAEAKCNRGTFYYHFTDTKELISTAIDRELFYNQSIAKIIIRTVCGDKSVIKEVDSIAPYINRIVLLAERGGMGIIVEKIKSATIKIWTTVLGVSEEGLNPTARLIIEYAISGLLGAITYGSKSVFPLEEPMKSEILIPFLETNSKFLAESICKAQGLGPAEAEARFKTLARFLEISNYSLDTLSTADSNLLKRLLAL